MGVVFPGNIHWGANNSRSFGFLADAMICINVAPELKEEIAFLLKAKIDTLSLEDASFEELLSFEKLVDAVIQLNTERAGRDFGDISYFPSYMEHLSNLKAQTARAIEFLRS